MAVAQDKRASELTAPVSIADTDVFAGYRPGTGGEPNLDIRASAGLIRQTIIDSLAAGDPSVPVAASGVVTADGVSAETKLSTLPVSIKEHDAVEGGEVDCSAALVAAAAVSSVIQIPDGIWGWDAQVTLPADKKWVGPGTIKFLSDTAYLRFGARSKVDGITFRGTIADDDQYELSVNGVASYFASPTYQDAAAVAVVDDTDFTHTLATNALTVGLKVGLTGTLGRYVVSSAITLGTSDRWAIWIDDAFVTGDAAAPIQFWKCDSGGAELSQYNPAGTGVWLMLESTAKLKIKVGCARHTHTKLTLTSIFDLSKIKIYKMTNYLASVDTATTPENGSQVGIYTNDVEVQNCTFEYMNRCALKIVGGDNNIVRNNTVRRCMSGITTQDGVNNKINGNDINLCWKDDLGAEVYSISMRNHGITLATTEHDSEALDNRIVGASWAIEAADSGGPPTNLRINRNDLRAAHCGISAGATGQKVNRNDIWMSSLGLYGIELPTADKTTCNGNTVYQDSPALLSYGIAGSKGLHDSIVSKNTLRANQMISIALGGATQGNHNLIIADNDGFFWTGMCKSQMGGTFLHRNTAKCLGRFSGNGTSPSVTINIAGSFYYSEVVGNIADGAGAYCIYWELGQEYLIQDNHFNGFTGNFADIYLAVSGSFTTLPYIMRNRVRNPASAVIATDGTPFAGSNIKLKDNYGGGTAVLTATNAPTYCFYLQDVVSSVAFDDAVTMPSTSTRAAQMAVDTSDGDLKIRYADGTLKLIVADT